MAATNHSVTIDGRVIRTPRLILRPWLPTDAPAALNIFQSVEVTRWLAPAALKVPDLASMDALVERWIAECGQPGLGNTHWAVEDATNEAVIGAAAITPMPPHDQDLLVSYQLLPETWGRGLGTETGHALAHYAFSHGVNELFAVVRPSNHRAAAVAARIGMDWVGETDKYFDLRLDVYRLTLADLDNNPLKPSPIAN